MIFYAFLSVCVYIAAEVMQAAISEDNSELSRLKEQLLMIFTEQMEFRYNILKISEKFPKQGSYPPKQKTFIIMIQAEDLISLKDFLAKSPLYGCLK